MADKNPVKYESAQHTPFASGDTLPPEVVNLIALLEAGPGISITPGPNGTVVISNTCCD